jgi:hypothetical protein
MWTNPGMCINWMTPDLFFLTDFRPPDMDTTDPKYTLFLTEGGKQS